jgi:transposase
VLSNGLGKSGQAILEALIAGQSDPERLADLAQGTARKKRAELVEALHGRIRPHHHGLLKVHLTLVATSSKRSPLSIPRREKPWRRCMRAPDS